MVFQDRYYQTDAVNNAWKWVQSHHGRMPVIVLPTGSGKSVVVPRIWQKGKELFPFKKLRMVVTVPSKELCAQNAEKLKAMLPGVSVGIYSASLDRFDTDTDIICATIGSIAKKYDCIGEIDIWVNDECHRVNTNGTGEYWTFALGLAKKSKYVGFGLTATDYRGDGVFITDGKRPMYSGVAHRTEIGELVRAGFLSPLVNPQSSISTRIDTSSVKMSKGDFDVSQLSTVTAKYLENAAYEAIHIAKDRTKWIAFLPDVKTANDFSYILNSLGISAAVVTGQTEDTKSNPERERLINDFKKGHIRCLISVLALSTGFDVPDIDCILWLRSTHSPVLYVQGAGRGTRTAEGKKDCLWIDFTDTTERLGAIDTIKGRPAKRKIKKDSPFIICPHCGEQWRPASMIYCAQYLKDDSGKFILDSSGDKILEFGCGSLMREIEDLDPASASTAEIMAAVNPQPEYKISQITCNIKKIRSGKKYIALEFFDRAIKVCSLNLYFGYIGLNEDSQNWWRYICGDHSGHYNTVDDCFAFLSRQILINRTMGIKFIKVDKTEKYPKLIGIMR
ncbi:putative ATP-dependent helicase [Serratia phage vB_SmaS_Opt-169]|nr:putative ATP-dependent helicase [Serratia phage vB_SmaS_Opt-169]